MLSELKTRAAALRANGGRRVHLGITLSPARVCALVRTRSLLRAPDGAAWEQEIAPATDDGQWPALADALVELRATLGGARIRASLALAPPLAHAKVLRVPPVAATRLGQLVQRNARRYFAAAAEPLVVDARPLGRAPRGEMPQVLAAYATEATLRGIVRAADTAGIEVVEITSASAALTRAHALPQHKDAGDLAMVVSDGGWNEIVYLNGRSPKLFRPLPGHAATNLPRLIAGDLERSAQAGARCDRTVLLCADDLRAEMMARELAAAGAPEPAAVDARGPGAVPPALAAARGVLRGGASLPQLLTEGLADARHRRERRKAAGLLAACVPVLIAAAAIHLWGLERELARIEDSRRSLAPAVAEALQARQAAESLHGWLETVARVEQEARETRWSETVAALATALPDSAYITSLVADSAAMHLSGFARGAHAVVPALQATPTFARASFSAPLQRDESSGRERFELTVPRPGGAAPPAAPGGAS